MNPTGLEFWILDDHGEPQSVGSDVLAWARWKERRDLHVAFDLLDAATGTYVSTMFFGYDMRLLLDLPGPPILWETMAFAKGEILHQQRYATRAGAVAGHQEVLAQMKGRV